MHALRTPVSDPAMEAHDRLIQALTNPALYPHPTTTITVLQTHISWVILTGPYAYKLKKPVNLGFVDFSTLAKRQFYCQEELRLNRRLAPQLYLDIVPITGSPEQPRWQGPGPIIAYAVKMVQFAQEQLLSHLVATGALHARHIDLLAQEVSALHGRIAVAQPPSPYGTPEAVLGPVQENFPPLLATVPEPTRRSQVDALAAWCQHTGAAHQATILVRQQQGYVRECHGDLHLGNMLLWDEHVVLFDGLEFNAGLRWIDVANDVAFLVMDLADHGRADLAHRFLNGYLEASGDYGLLTLLPFYCTYRALVRAKVASIRLGQAGLTPHEVEQAQQVLGSYLDLALSYTRPPRPYVLVAHGLSGSGKTFVTQQVIEATGAIRLRSDVERKRLYGLEPLARVDPGQARSLYSPEATERTYAHLAQQARQIVHAGFPVVIDAACLTQAQRQLFYDLAVQLGVPCRLLACQASPATLRQRVQQRRQHGQDASDADLAVLEQQCASLEPLTATEHNMTWTIHTEAPTLPPHLWEAMRQLGAEAADLGKG